MGRCRLNAKFVVQCTMLLRIQLKFMQDMQFMEDKISRHTLLLCRFGVFLILICKPHLLRFAINRQEKETHSKPAERAIPMKRSEGRSLFTATLQATAVPN